MIDSLITLYNLLLSNPLAVLIPLAIAVPIALLKWRIVGRGVRKSRDAQTAGWQQGARRKAVPHDTGIGTRDILVMKPAAIGYGTLGFAILFFGGGAVFYALTVLQRPDVAPKDWLTFAICAGFTLAALALVLHSFSRIHVTETEILARHPLRPTRRFSLSALTTVAPARKSLKYGARLAFNDGRSLRVLASYTGYRELLVTLSRIQPDLALIVRFLSPKGP